MKYRCNPQLLNMIVKLSILTFLLVKVNSFLCSAYCSPNSCTGINSNQCTACDPPFVFQTGGTCIVDVNSGYQMFA